VSSQAFNEVSKDAVWQTTGSGHEGNSVAMPRRVTLAVPVNEDTLSMSRKVPEAWGEKASDRVTVPAGMWAGREAAAKGAPGRDQVTVWSALASLRKTTVRWLVSVRSVVAKSTSCTANDKGPFAVCRGRSWQLVIEPRRVTPNKIPAGRMGWFSHVLELAFRGPGLLRPAVERRM
jgi:hypothetical protein